MSTAVNESRSRMEYGVYHLSTKTAKRFLANTPKHGPVRQRTMKYYLGLTATDRQRVEPKKKQEKK